MVTLGPFLVVLQRWIYCLDIFIVFGSVGRGRVSASFVFAWRKLNKTRLDEISRTRSVSRQLLACCCFSRLRNGGMSECLTLTSVLSSCHNSIVPL